MKEKLIYPFDTSKCLEINHPNWNRVTPREFRSFSGERRIYNVKTNQYDMYEGPVYAYGSNIVVKNPPKGYVYLNDIDPRISQKTIFGR